jgi:hypothetical protein
MYNFAVQCKEKRENYRDDCVPEENRDTGHEYPILVSEKLINIYLAYMEFLGSLFDNVTENIEEIKEVTDSEDDYGAEYDAIEEDISELYKQQLREFNETIEQMWEDAHIGEEFMVPAISEYYSMYYLLEPEYIVDKYRDLMNHLIIMAYNREIGDFKYRYFKDHGTQPDELKVLLVRYRSHTIVVDAIAEVYPHLKFLIEKRLQPVYSELHEKVEDFIRLKINEGLISNANVNKKAYIEKLRNFVINYSFDENRFNAIYREELRKYLNR